MEDNDVGLQDRILCAVVQTAEIEAQKVQISVSRPVMRAVSDLVLRFMELLAVDLETFAQHAGRKSVNVDDVLLTARRNPDVAAKLMPLVQELARISKQEKDEKLRRRPESKEKRKKQVPDDGAGPSASRDNSKCGPARVNAKKGAENVVKDGVS